MLQLRGWGPDSALRLPGFYSWLCQLSDSGSISIANHLLKRGQYQHHP